MTRYAYIQYWHLEKRMEHAEMVALIRPGGEHTAGIWADLGAGAGNFTRALAALLEPQATIYDVLTSI